MEVDAVPGVTMKVPGRTHQRIRALADRSQRSMSAVLEDALDTYERSIREAEYLEGWERFRRDDPDGFADYRQECREIEVGLGEAIHE